MPIGLVSDSEFEASLRSLSIGEGKSEQDTRARVHIPEVLPIKDRGRSEGDVNVPDSLRQIIGETSVLDGRQAALSLARDFGISASSVSAYANGATSTKSYDTPSKSIISHINKSRRRAIKSASGVLNQALGAITQEKLDNADVRDVSAIAKDMAVIIKNLEPPPDTTKVDDSSKQPQFVIYAPQFRDERSFEQVVVQE